MPQPRDPSNDFVEFIQVWGGLMYEYLEGVVMYDSRNGSKCMLCHILNNSATVFNNHCLEPLQGLRFK